ALADRGGDVGSVLDAPGRVRPRSAPRRVRAGGVPYHAALPRLLQLHRVHPTRSRPPRAHRTRAATPRSPAGGRDGHRWRRAPLAASKRARVRARRSGVLAITSAEPRRRMARALAPYLPSLLLF